MDDDGRCRKSPAAASLSRATPSGVRGDRVSHAADDYFAERPWWKRWLYCGCCWPFVGRGADNDSLLGASGANRSSSVPGASTRPQSAETVLAEQQLKAQIAYYSTRRVHMKRVQLCLEQEKRNKFYKELVIYVIFLALILTTVLSLPVHFPYEQNAALSDLFFDEEFPDIEIKKTFSDVMTEDEVWQWVDGPLFEGYYSLPLRNNRRIGSIMLRTGRVSGQMCRDMDNRNDFVLFEDEVCFPSFDVDVEYKKPYGNARGALKQSYKWRDGMEVLRRSQTFTPGLVSHSMNYGDGGYAVYLPRENETAAKAIVSQLKEDFLTDSTRYLVATFSFYNQQSNLFTFVQALYEMSDTDYMETSARVKSFRIMSSYTDTQAFLQDNVFMILLSLATLWLLYRELSDLRDNGISRYLHSLWNVLDVAQLVILIFFIQAWVQYIIKAEKLRHDLFRVVDLQCDGPAHDQTAAADCYVDVGSLAWLYMSVNDFASTLALISIVIVFKYLRLNSRLNLLWRTLRHASKDLLGFAFIFFILFSGYAVMGLLIFGSSTRGYHSLSMSLISCFQMLLGAFDYSTIQNANPTMVAVFFFSFMITVYLVCVNMFIAIMSEYYSLSQNEMREHEAQRRNFVTQTSGGDGDFRDSLQFVDVEYDIIRQLTSYWHRMRIQVQLPPSSPSFGSQLTTTPLYGCQRVLLVDYDYLMAERKRLRAKLRAYVHLVTTCLSLLRVTNSDFEFRLEPECIADKRPRASSNDSSMDYVDFPVTYIPISSKATNVVEALKCLRKGNHIDMDDGSLTKDQITLQVLGDQDAYVPPNYKLQEDFEFDEDCTSEVRIANSEDGERVGNRRFGLHHVHSRIGGGEHIRSCRVLYNGETVVEGKEMCSLPPTAWVKYLFRHLVWGGIKRAFSMKRRTKKQRLISDAEVDRLITENFITPGRGMSCRFDELVRNFRMFIAKKIHRRHMRIRNLDERIFMEVINFLERFPSAHSPLDKRELEGYKYTPQPVDTRRVRLPNSVNMLAEILSQNAHEVWSAGRIEQGWRWGPARDNDTKLHPDLVPYESLTEEDKQYDRDTSLAALKVITALGYILEPPDHMEELKVSFGTKATEPGGTYMPRPIPTNKVHLPPHLKSLVELLAENTHEVWAKMRMEQGWVYGPRRNDEKREHNGLVPYIYLTPEEKQMDRNTAMEAVKVILQCGFNFVHRDQRGNKRIKKKRSSKMKVVGRSENPSANHVKDAVTLARGTSRARDAFLRNNSRGNSVRRRRGQFASSPASSTSTVTSQSAFGLQRQASTATASVTSQQSTEVSTLRTESVPDIVSPRSESSRAEEQSSDGRSTDQTE